MTRVIRIESCEQCPYALNYCGCRKMPYKNKYGRTLYREFDNPYPEIPEWCPLEEVAP